MRRKTVEYSIELLKAAHKASYANKRRLSIPQKCGCFYCMRFFSFEKIEDWSIDQPDWTAVCPYCGIDSVIGENDGYPLTNEFLEGMHKEWFE